MLEAHEPLIRRTRRLLELPRQDRFDGEQLRAALERSGLEVLSWRRLGGWTAWCVALKPPQD